MDNLTAERFEIDTLIEKGMSFTTPKRSLLRYFGKSERMFTISQPYLGTLNAMASHYARISFDEKELEANPINESKLVVHQNAERCATIVAIAVLNQKWKIKLLTPFLANYFLWRITPAKLFQLTILINSISNLGDFIHAIRYLNMIPRTTSPNLVAEKQED